MQKKIILVGVFCLLVCLAGSAAYGYQYFSPAIGYSAGSYPTAVASADFNGDNIPDLAIANSIGNSISVLIGNGDGSFITPQTLYSTGSSQHPYHVTTGDMDLDGNIDIVTAGTMGIVTFYGNGDGTFAAADVYYFAQSALDVVVADFDHDGYLDIATSHTVIDSVGIHINNHDSTYTTHFVQVGNGSVSLALGNLDGDNWIDMLVGCSQGTVWNLKNDQAGSFIGTEVHIGLLNDPASVAIIDFNGDGIGDFGVIHAINDFLFTFLNNGDGTYTSLVGYNLTDNPTNLTFADVNGDDLDDALISISTTDEIELYLNQGDSTFIYDSSYTTGGTPKGVTFVDLDGDGYKDMVAASYTNDRAVIFMSRLSLILSVDDIDNGGVLPTDFSLGQNYPNPFNPETHIRFSLPRASQVRVEVFNTLGQSVMVLVDEYLTAGLKEITWNGVNASGQKVASGVYLYRITTDQFTDTKTMVLLK